MPSWHGNNLVWRDCFLIINCWSKHVPHVPVWFMTLQNVTDKSAQWEGMGDVGSARYELALLPPCPTVRVLSCSNSYIFRNCERRFHFGKYKIWVSNISAMHDSDKQEETANYKVEPLVVNQCPCTIALVIKHALVKLNHTTNTNTYNCQPLYIASKQSLCIIC